MPYYSRIILNSFSNWLFPKLFQYNRRSLIDYRNLIIIVKRIWIKFLIIIKITPQLNANVILLYDLLLKLFSDHCLFHTIILCVHIDKLMGKLLF